MIHNPSFFIQHPSPKGLGVIPVLASVAGWHYPRGLLVRAGDKSRQKQLSKDRNCLQTTMAVASPREAS